MARDESEQAKASRLARLVSSKEPRELRPYLAVLRENAAYHAGSTVPAIGDVRRLASGLWVPANAQLAPAPIDLVQTYITFHEVFAEPADLTGLRAILRRYARDDVLRTCGTLLRAMAENDLGVWEQSLAHALQQPQGSRLASALRQGRPVFSRQGLYVLASCRRLRPIARRPGTSARGRDGVLLAACA